MGKYVGVIVPSHQEEKLITKTLDGIPSLVDRIFVVEDGSTDKTLALIKTVMKKDPRITLIAHPKNLGLGKSLIDGYHATQDTNIDIIAVMAGDNQMDPNDLERVLEPVASNACDYVKGNRLLRDDVMSNMPRHRYLGNSFLTFLTKFATGYWKIIDPQCGYTAISKKALSVIPIEEIVKGYGYNACILHMLNLNNFKVKDVEVRPVYGAEKSGIKIISYSWNISILLTKLFIKRIRSKYLVREFNPLVFFYAASFLSLFFVALPMLARSLVLYINNGEFPEFAVIIFFFSSQFSLLFFFFGIWLDMEDNKDLCVT